MSKYESYPSRQARLSFLLLNLQVERFSSWYAALHPHSNASFSVTCGMPSVTCGIPSLSGWLFIGVIGYLLRIHFAFVRAWSIAVVWWLSFGRRKRWFVLHSVHVLPFVSHIYASGCPSLCGMKTMYSTLITVVADICHFFCSISDCSEPEPSMFFVSFMSFFLLVLSFAVAFTNCGAKFRALWRIIFSMTQKTVTAGRGGAWLARFLAASSKCRNFVELGGGERQGEQKLPANERYPYIPFPFINFGGFASVPSDPCIAGRNH